MRLTRTMAIACLAVASLAPMAAAQGAAASRAINDACPISGEPIDGKTFVESDGHVIGFCCPGCDSAFKRWNDDRRMAFIMKTMQEGEGAIDGAAAPGQGAPAEKRKGDPYTLDTCPVAGGKLGSMGDPVVKVYDGREVRFCCAACVPTFESNPKKYWKAIDQKMVKDQLPYYPMETCLVMGHALAGCEEEEQAEEGPVNLIYRNRLVRLCCDGCIADFEAKPDVYLTKLDDAAAGKQRKDYPLETCLVAGSRLGSMGDPHEIIVAGRLVRFCCASCEQTLRNSPVKYLSTLEKAWEKKLGRSMRQADASEGEG
jgi:YHS domain-containing protein